MSSDEFESAFVKSCECSAEGSTKHTPSFVRVYKYPKIKQDGSLAQIKISSITSHHHQVGVQSRAHSSIHKGKRGKGKGGEIGNVDQHDEGMYGR